MPLLAPVTSAVCPSRLALLAAWEDKDASVGAVVVVHRDYVLGYVVEVTDPQDLKPRFIHHPVASSSTCESTKIAFMGSVPFQGFRFARSLPPLLV
jgi:ABC-type uncharacterized transport system YnjBCD permease subunit